MSKIKFEALCGATVEVDPRLIVSIHIPYRDNYLCENGEGIYCGQIVLGCDSQVMVDGDTFWRIAKAMEEARKCEKV